MLPNFLRIAMTHLTPIRRAVLLTTLFASGLLTACGGGSDADFESAAGANESAQGLSTDSTEYEAVGLTDEISTAGWTTSADTIEQMTADAVREHAVFASKEHPADLCGDVTWLGS